MNANRANSITRRSFLASGVAATAAMSAGAIGDNRLRVGFIGPGRYGSDMLTELETIGPEFDANVVAVHRDSLETIARSGANAVMIATPDRLHAETAIAALELGLHVFCAPPMAMTEPDARAVRDAARASGRVYRVGANSIHETRWQAARALVRSGAIGEVRWVSATTHEYPTDFQEDWKTDARYTHGAAAHHLHELWAACAYATGAGAPLRVTAMGGGNETDPALPDGLSLSADFAGGGHFNLDCRPAPQSVPHGSIRGSIASLIICHECIVSMPDYPADAPLEEEWRGDLEWNGSPLRSWLSDMRTGETSGMDARMGYGAATGIAKAMNAYQAVAKI